MIFGDIPLSQAEGALLARAIGGFKKGQQLSAAHIAQLRQKGVEAIRGARLEADDVAENDAANIIGAALAGGHIRHHPAAQGRIHFHADNDGLVLMDEQKINALNHVSADIALASCAPFALVSSGQLIATLKIIPLACAKTDIQQATTLAAQADLRLAPFRPLNAALLCATNPAKKDMSAKAAQITQQRIEKLGGQLTVAHCADDSAAMAEKIKTLPADLILIHGAQAIMDRRDTIPSAIEQIGGRLIHFGMPTDPGNLLLLAEYHKIPIIGLPGCARSPKRNGLDLVLERIAAGLAVSSDDIMSMGVGGLMLGSEMDQERYGA